MISEVVDTNVIRIEGLGCNPLLLLRNLSFWGYFALLQNLCYGWGARLTPLEVADKVKHLFKYYSINQHKMTILTPSYHAESYSPEDNRFGLRQFLYSSRWPYQFRKIDELVKELDGEKIPFSGSNVHEKLGAIGGMGVIAAGSGNHKAGH